MKGRRGERIHEEAKVRMKEEGRRKIDVGGRLQLASTQCGREEGWGLHRHGDAKQAEQNKEQTIEDLDRGKTKRERKEKKTKEKRAG